MEPPQSMAGATYSLWGRKIMSTYALQMQAIFRRYQAEVSPDPADPREVGAWALREGLWHPKPADILARFAEDVANSLRQEYRTDAAGALIPCQARCPRYEL